MMKTFKIKKIRNNMIFINNMINYKNKKMNNQIIILKMKNNILFISSEILLIKL